MKAVKNKAQVWVFNALKEIRENLPFPLLGIDSDNGSEFINAHLLRYCEREKITFTRTRSYRKNDNCFVEQKNYSVVRKAVGYFRYDTEKELESLNELYHYYRLFVNFFLAVVKLVAKERRGSKVKKIYDKPKAPYERVLECSEIPEEVKNRLMKEYSNLNPAEIKREMKRAWTKLWKAYKEKKELLSFTEVHNNI
jgi:hypothetical protein